MWWWVLALVLAGVGGWLVMRGLFGHRRLVTRSRQCPRCRYDMTGLPGGMTCAECGFTARDEASWYGGRRRPVQALLGGVVLLAAFAAVSWPVGREMGYLSMLPLRVQIEVWPTWLRTLRFIGLKGEAEWGAVERIPHEIKQSNSQSLRRAVWKQGLSELRRLDPLSEEADSVAYIMMQTPLIEWPGETDLAIEASPENVLYMLRHPNECAVAAGMNLAPFATDDVDEIFSEIASIRGTPRDAEGDPVYAMIEVDRRYGHEWIERVLASGSDPDLGVVAMWTASYAVGAIYQNPQYPVTPPEKFDRDLELALRWLRDGPPITRSALTIQMIFRSYYLKPQWNEAGEIEGFKVPLRKPEAYKEILGLCQDMIATDESMLIAQLSRQMQRENFTQFRLISSVLRRSILDEVAERILGFLEIEPKGMSEALGDLETFAADPSRSLILRERATALAREIRLANPQLGGEDAGP